jgi:integrase
MAVRKPTQQRKIAIQAPSPMAVERMRAELIAQDRLRDATLICVLAYAGLRPGEAVALRWSDVRERTILVERALALGEVKSTKTRRIRAVRLLAPLADDLAALRKSRPAAKPDDLIFGRVSDGGRMTEIDYRNWRRRIYAVAAKRAGLRTQRPYDLRHAFVSLLLAEGRSVVEVAAQAGHAPTMTLDTYAHVIAELEGAERRPAEELIAEVRAMLAPAGVEAETDSIRARRRLTVYAFCTRAPDF